MLRYIIPYSVKSITVDKAMFEGTALNLVESSVRFTDKSLSYRFEYFCSLNIHFQSLFERMNKRFQKCLVLHCQYIEIYRRLNNTSTTNSRRFRHYAIDHLTVLIHNLLQIMFLMNGFIIRSEDAAETAASHIDPELFMAFCKKNVETDECTTIQSSMASLSGIRVMRAALLKDALPPMHGDQFDIKQFDLKMALCREYCDHWLLDSIDMIEVFQTSMNTKVCVGPAVLPDGNSYNLTFVPHTLNGHQLSISPHTIGKKLDLDYGLINHNIENQLIPDAIDCSVGFDVMNDQDYFTVVTNEVKQKMASYAESSRTLRLSTLLDSFDKTRLRIRDAENSGIYVDEKHLFWW
jgi:hypothetical protein